MPRKVWGLVVLVSILFQPVARASPAEDAAPRSQAGPSTAKRVVWTLIGAGIGFGAGLMFGLRQFDDAIDSDRKVWTSALVGAGAGGVAGALLSGLGSSNPAIRPAPPLNSPPEPSWRVGRGSVDRALLERVREYNHGWDHSQVAADPDDPRIPADPDDPRSPADPDDPRSPADPDDPRSPADPDDPRSPADPDDPRSPTDPDDPRSPADPDDPRIPTDPDNPRIAADLKDPRIATDHQPRITEYSRMRSDATWSQRGPAKGDSLRNGMIAGAIVGGIIGLVIVPATQCKSSNPECPGLLRIGVGIPAVASGAAIGALVDKLFEE